MAETTFGRYQLTRLLARGGMAEVYLAVLSGAAGFEKRIALKKILPIYTDLEEFTRLFQDEARISVTLNHSNIVQVFDFGVHHGEHYLAMEYIDGPDLEKVLMGARKLGRQLAIDTVLYIAMRVASALEYAHSRVDDQGRSLDLVHRDVSPPNVLLSVQGEVKLTDFGVARYQARLSKSRPGVVRGKYAYMSPEQLTGDVLDSRSDLFSLGVVLYEMLTNVNPFLGDTDYQTMERVVACRPPNPTEYRPDIPRDLVRILERCLRSHPGTRYQYAGQIRRDLAELMFNRGVIDDPQLLSDELWRLFPRQLSRRGVSVPRPRAPGDGAVSVGMPRMRAGHGVTTGDEWGKRDERGPSQLGPASPDMDDSIDEDDLTIPHIVANPDAIPTQPLDGGSHTMDAPPLAPASQATLQEEEEDPFAVRRPTRTPPSSRPRARVEVEAAPDATHDIVVTDSSLESVTVPEAAPVPPPALSPAAAPPPRPRATPPPPRSPVPRRAEPERIGRPEERTERVDPPPAFVAPMDPPSAVGLKAVRAEALLAKASKPAAPPTAPAPEPPAPPETAPPSSVASEAAAEAPATPPAPEAPATPPAPEAPTTPPTPEAPATAPAPPPAAPPPRATSAPARPPARSEDDDFPLWGYAAVAILITVVAWMVFMAINPAPRGSTDGPTDYVPQDPVPPSGPTPAEVREADPEPGDAAGEQPTEAPSSDEPGDAAVAESATPGERPVEPSTPEPATAAPRPEPTPRATPEPTPERPEPTPAPAPDPTPEPAPDPTPEPPTPERARPEPSTPRPEPTPAESTPAPVAEAAASSVEVTVVTEPVGAELTIDGKSVGSAPWTSRADTGAILEITARMDGYLSTTRLIRVGEGPTQVTRVQLSRQNVSAEAAPVRVTITSTPWAYVAVDGRVLGKSTPVTVELTPGTHTIVVENPLESWSESRTVDVAEGEPVTLTFEKK